MTAGTEPALSASEWLSGIDRGKQNDTHTHTHTGLIDATPVVCAATFQQVKDHKLCVHYHCYLLSLVGGHMFGKQYAAMRRTLHITTIKSLACVKHDI